MYKLLSYYSIFLVLLLSGCNNHEEIQQASPEQIKKESKKANNFFDRCYAEAVDRDPEQQTRLRIKKDYGKWTDRSDAFVKSEMQIAKKELDTLLKGIDLEKLDDQTRTSYRYFQYNAQQTIDAFKWRFYNYPVNQVDGFQKTIPAFLINMHHIDNLSDAQAYIDRLKGIGTLFEQEMDGLKMRDSLKIIPPQFVFPLVINDCRNIISGQPFDKGPRKCSLLEDFTTKVYTLQNVDGATKSQLIEEAKNALINVVEPSYINLISYLSNEEKKATNDAGVWKFPEGKAFYTFAIKQTTTEDISPEKLFETGENDLNRIHDEMQEIMQKVKYKGGSLESFYDFMQNNSAFYFANSAQGRESFIDEATNILNSMENNLDRFFKTVPKADIVIRAAEPNRDQANLYAFYEKPSDDDKHPGICYFNLSEMKDQPVYQIESRVYHNGIPGYHIQVCIADELKNIPEFRKHGSNIAYEEGWALYAEYFPKEYGFYTDPYSDFGRLATEAMRASSLVADVGIHSKHWTKEKAIQYLLDNAPYTEADAKKEIESCIVCPSKATGYKAGMSKIMQLRETAKKSLDKKFDIREFHDVILTNGPLPLSLVEDNVNFWINDKFGRQ